MTACVKNDSLSHILDATIFSPPFSVVAVSAAQHNFALILHMSLTLWQYHCRLLDPCDKRNIAHPISHCALQCLVVSLCASYLLFTEVPEQCLQRSDHQLLMSYADTGSLQMRRNKPGYSSLLHHKPLSSCL